ncbi:MAG: hypothetical protein ABGZ17_20745, partial [Planctomycetaceae bacterium]
KLALWEESSHPKLGVHREIIQSARDTLAQAADRLRIAGDPAGERRANEPRRGSFAPSGRAAPARALWRSAESLVAASTAFAAVSSGASDQKIASMSASEI